MAAVALSGSGVLALVVIAGVAYVVYKKKDDMKKVFTEDLNPMSDKNLATRAVDAVTQTVTGDPNQTFGGAIYDMLHPNVFDPKQYTSTPKPVTGNPNFYSTSASNMTSGQAGVTVDAALRQNEIDQQIKETMYGGAGLMDWQPALDGATGRMVMVPKLTPATWALIAGVSFGLYYYGKKSRRGRH